MGKLSTINWSEVEEDETWVNMLWLICQKQEKHLSGELHFHWESASSINKLLLEKNYSSSFPGIGFMGLGDCWTVENTPQSPGQLGPLPTSPFLSPAAFHFPCHSGPSAHFTVSGSASATVLEHLYHFGAFYSPASESLLYIFLLQADSCLCWLAWDFFVNFLFLVSSWLCMYHPYCVLSNWRAVAVSLA